MAETLEALLEAGFTVDSVLAAAASKVDQEPPDWLDKATEPESDAVVVAYVHSGGISYSWHRSMVELIGWDLANSNRVVRGGYIAIRYGTDGMTLARNKAVSEFLSEGKADWMCWIDTDMGFPADMVDRLLEAADPVERPIVGALCFAQEEHTDDGLGGFRCRAIPTIYDWAKVGDQMGFAVRWQYPIDTLTRCQGTGSAAILIHRSVFEKVEERYGRVWYDRVPNTTTGQVLGEDLAFCLRAGTLDISVHIHTGVKTTHHKHFWLSEEDYWTQVAQQAGTGPAMAPPATERTAVIVPVMKRPHNAQPFMDSLLASTGMARVYAICDTDDDATATAWALAGATVLYANGVGTAGTFAEKVNVGYRRTREPWLFLVGDDVKFRSGWLDHAQAVAGDTFGVVGTNDLGNPRVTRGEHATHLLVRRSYVDEVGASWDGPGVVAHEGYRHWFVDDEIVAAAKQRGLWTMALSSVVEHMHPLFGKAEGDEVYRLGQSFAEQDKELFERRVKENDGR